MLDKTLIIKEAQRYLARGLVDKAIAEWEKLSKEYSDGTIYNTIGDLYLKKGDDKNAVNSFHKAADCFRNEGFSHKSLALYKKILNINASDANALFSIGELNESKGLITDAIKYYLAAADSLSKEGRKEKLLEIYGKILAVSPSNIPLRNKIAEIYVKEGLVSEAANQHLHIARLYDEKGDSEKSILYYQKILDAQPLHREAILEINDLYEKTGNLEQAIKHIKEASTLFPQDIDIHLRCAHLYIIGKLFAEAKKYLKKVIEIEPAHIKARTLLGEIYSKEGKREKAWTEYLPIVDEMIRDVKYNDAIKLLESFRDIDPMETGKRLVSLYKQLGENLRVAHELVSLGDISAEKGMQNEALAYYREALEITPDDDSLISKAIELDKEIGLEHSKIEGEKTVQDLLAEADIFIGYGLYQNAKDILEELRQKEPESIDLHLMLKSLYVNMDNKEQAVTECLELSELYKKAGDVESREQILKEAYEIYPEDPRLIETTVPPVTEEPVLGPSPEVLEIEDYSEEIAEADFYLKQGLTDEARDILERLQKLFPENEEIKQKLSSLGQAIEEPVKREVVEEPHEELIIQESEILEAQDIQEPALDSDVLDIFNEFKKGLEKELEEEDYETHYNLGIAYKELGLIDDAIREFQTARNDPKSFIQSLSMLGICYMEKGMYPLAIDVITSALEKMEDQGESYWAMKYDLAEAYEKNGNIKEALNAYTEVYGWNSKFRAVSDKITRVRAKLPKDDEEGKPSKRKD
ncbi:MAG: tetratricopeptide repeat protein, partial [Nitrospirota bacterium]|nr:tetratricopeptide repeat protein [Nitrospirota bacterium]